MMRAHRESPLPSQPDPCVRSLSNADDQDDGSGVAENAVSQAANDDEMMRIAENQRRIILSLGRPRRIEASLAPLLEEYDVSCPSSTTRLGHRSQVVADWPLILSRPCDRARLAATLREIEAAPALRIVAEHAWPEQPRRSTHTGGAGRAAPRRLPRMTRFKASGEDVTGRLFCSSSVIAPQTWTVPIGDTIKKKMVHART